MEVRILIVEDEALIALQLESLVAEQGHRVIGIAFDFDEAVALAQAERPDFAIVDVRLRAGSRGLDAARYLWRILAVPVIFVSGSLDASTRQEIADLGALACIEKPFLSETVIAAIAEAVLALGLGRAKAHAQRD